MICVAAEQALLARWRRSRRSAGGVRPAPVHPARFAYKRRCRQAAGGRGSSAGRQERGRCSASSRRSPGLVAAAGRYQVVLPVVPVYCGMVPGGDQLPSTGVSGVVDEMLSRQVPR